MAAIRVRPEARSPPPCDTWDVGCSVLIVDDHPSFRAWAHAFLEAEGYQVVGEAAGGAAAVLAVDRLRPDFVLLDVHLPDLDGFEVARQVAGFAEPPAVVLVSSRDGSDFGRRVT
jgi:DNA-binding NarL/FixJ family response regulator